MVRVTVFGSSSSKTPSKYLEAAFTLGVLLAEHHHVLVNGGGNAGVMGSLNHGARSKGGEIVGVIHEKFIVDKSEDHLILNMITTSGDDLSARKQGLLDNGDCVLVMPGGVGTFEELWDAVSGKSLEMKGMKDKPICVVNVDGYFDGSIMQLQRAYDDCLLYHKIEDYFHVESTPAAALAWCVTKLKDAPTTSKDHVAEVTRLAHRA